MYSFKAYDISEALMVGLRTIYNHGVEEQSRFGPVLVASEPVCTEFMDPRQRVLYSPTRDANPYFHFMESLWMLSGSNDIEFPVFFNSKYGQFSDDGKTMWDAYGWRWRSFFGWDQLKAIAKELRDNPTSRRCVLSMWNSADWSGSMDSYDMPVTVLSDGRTYCDDFAVATHGGKAVPCNTQAYFDVRGGQINMTVTNRSNDAIWGCYGANAVHFSFLLEYMAAMIGVRVGVYRQFSNNLHIYTERFNADYAQKVIHECDTMGVKPLASPAHVIEKSFDEDNTVFMKNAMDIVRGTSAYVEGGYQGALFNEVALPMLLSYACHKHGIRDYAINYAESIAASDWRLACVEWLQRRYK